MCAFVKILPKSLVVHAAIVTVDYQAWINLFPHCLCCIHMYLACSSQDPDFLTRLLLSIATFGHVYIATVLSNPTKVAHLTLHLIDTHNLVLQVAFLSWFLLCAYTMIRQQQKLLVSSTACCPAMSCPLTRWMLLRLFWCACKPYQPCAAS